MSVHNHNSPDYKKLYLSAQTAISQLQESLNIHKQAIENLISQEKEVEQKHKDEILILQQLVQQNKDEHLMEKYELKDQITTLKDALEEKEYQFQVMEHKWSKIDSIITEYARCDPYLVSALDEARYLCDDVTTNRKITTVASENHQLRIQVQEMKSEISEMKSNMTNFDYCDEAKANEALIDEPLKLKHKSSKNLHYHENILDTNEVEKGTHLKPPKPDRAAGTSRLKGDRTKSTKGFFAFVDSENKNDQKELKLTIPAATFGDETDDDFDSLNESSIKVTSLEDNSHMDSVSSMGDDLDLRDNEMLTDLKTCLKGIC
ncbi:unnamed protein product [Moneuplotes crassus]|uniref:Uncharacterized protein n=1 Tax=Euplotes crassus TaxID=5936 RepID=A0AAD1U0S1_EUPCR|nr:unnamed protein product [Moneuplotes crassus]